MATLPLEPQSGPSAALLDWFLGHREHQGGGGLVDQAVPIELLEDPVLARQPGQNPRFDGRVVGYDEPAALRGDERGPYQLGQDEGWGTVGQLQQVKLAVFDKFAGGR